MIHFHLLNWPLAKSFTSMQDLYEQLRQEPIFKRMSTTGLLEQLQAHTFGEETVFADWCPLEEEIHGQAFLVMNTSLEDLEQELDQAADDI